MGDAADGEGVSRPPAGDRRADREEVRRIALGYLEEAGGDLRRALAAAAADIAATGSHEGFSRRVEYPPLKVDLWSEGGANLQREIGLALTKETGWALYRAAIAEFPGREVTLRQRARVLASVERGDR